jgi:DNA-binding MarR family transcriptional regulator
MFWSMGRALMERLKQARPFSHPRQEAAVNVLLAAAWLNDRLDRALEPLELSHTQYNVLRILKGADPAGHPRCEIACRMIDRAPDVTRIIDRLERRGLVERARDPRDGRRSLTRITRAGSAALARATPLLEAVEAEFASRLSRSDIEDLSRTCESLYTT